MYSKQKCECAFVYMHLCVCICGGKFSFTDDFALQNSFLHICFANASQRSGRVSDWD